MPKMDEHKHSGKPLRVGMLTYSFYESDGRVRRYAETLARRGDRVDVISLRNEKQSSFDRLKGVNVYRIQKRVRDEKGKCDYFFRVMKFFFRSAAMVTSNHLKQPYDFIHVHSVPDFEVFAAIVPKLMGAKVILDIHDPVPDFFEAKFGYGKKSIFFKILSLIEKYSCHFADHVITVTDYWLNVIKDRSNIPSKKISAIVNYPDTEIFNITKAKKIYNSEDCFKILYPGTLNKHCALHIVIEAMGLLRNEIPKLRFDIYGKGTEENYLRSLVIKLGLEQTVYFHNVVPIETVPDLMANADIGVALLGGNHNYLKQALNVKLFEFLAMGLPAIASRVDSIKKYVGEKVVMLSNPNDPEDVARCIIELYKNHNKREQLRKEGLIFAQKNNWMSQTNSYLGIIQNFLRDNKSLHSI
jgi:glycosyltransferase involved in cell wall biosynthesis